MNKFSKITGSIIVASLLFSMNGCGDDDKKSSSTEEAVQNISNGLTDDTNLAIENTTQNATKLTQEDLNNITRDTVTENLSADEIVSRVISASGDITNADGSKITNGRDLLIALAQGDEESLAEISNLSDTEVTQTLIEALGTSSNKSSQKSRTLSSQKSLLDTIKDGLVDLTNGGVVGDVVNEAFVLMLKSGTATKEALKLAIGSWTITQIMINTMNDNWGLAEQMQPLLENDVEFGNLFMDLALAHKGRDGFSKDAEGNDILDAAGNPIEKLPMAEFLFARIDAAMYHSLTIAMTNSRNDTEFVTAEHPAGYLTTVLSTLMAQPEMAKFFAIPKTLDYTDGLEITAFSKLLFTNGAVIKAEDGVVTGHGDGAELSNERFFYEMFATPESTANFITAMNNVETSEDPTLGEDTKVNLMNQIFLAENDLSDTDEEQAYFNIYSIAGGMAKGLGEGGANFADYKDNFVGFAKLMPYSLDSFSYGASFVSALSTYFDNNESAYADEFKTLFRGTSFDIDDNDSLINDYFAVKASFDEALDYLGLLSDDAISFVNGVDFDKLYEGTTRVQFFSDIPAQSVETYSPLTLEAEYLNSKLYGSELTWDYIPNKFAQRDWIKADNNVTTATFNYSSGTVTAYVVSSASLDVVNSDTGFTFSEVDLAGDTLLSSDVNATYNVYSMDIATDTTVSLTSLTQNSSVSALFFDCSNATPNASELPADTNATN